MAQDRQRLLAGVAERPGRVHVLVLELDAHFGPVVEHQLCSVPGLSELGDGPEGEPLA